MGCAETHKRGKVIRGLTGRVVSTTGGAKTSIGGGRSARGVTRTGGTFTRCEFWWGEVWLVPLESVAEEEAVTEGFPLREAEGVKVVTRVSTKGAAAAREVLFCAKRARGVKRARRKTSRVS